jgi:hypothetical protein
LNPETLVSNYSAAENYRNITLRAVMIFYSPTALTADLLQSNSCLVDNLFADLWKQMGMKALLNKAGFSKR